MKHTSLGQMFLDQCRLHADRTALLVPGKEGHTPVTYSEYADRVFRIARALNTLGVEKGDRVVLQAENSDRWACVDWACQTLGAVLVPIYPTLPPDQSQYIVGDCGAKLVVSGDQTQAAKMEGFEGINVVLLDELPEIALKRNDIPDLDRGAWEENARTIAGETIATFIYTSGTTGNPKGVMLTHQNFIFLCESVPLHLPINQNDTFLSFLPLSHVFERFGGHVLPVSLGATIAYAKSVLTLANDMATVKPTIMLVVPRFLDSLKTRIEDGIAKKGGLSEKLFKATLRQGARKRRGMSAPFYPILQSIVGKKIAARMGGRMRFFASGGAALPPHVCEFYLSLGVNVLQGYGLTETCAATCLNLPDDNRPDTVGPPFQGIDIKIAPDGEILIKGDCVMTGYFNLPEDTAQAIDSEGWFHTGDIGEVTDSGRVRITDRKKDLLVLANGKNVAPQPIENKLKQSDWINEAMLMGDGQEYCSALIVPEFERIKPWLAEQGIKLETTEEMVARDEVKQLIKAEVDAVNKNLADFERVKRHVLAPAPFSIDGGELTPSLKVRRKVVRDKYQDLVATLNR